MTATKGFVVPTGGGKSLPLPRPGRSAVLKLLGRDTNGSILLFEDTLSAGSGGAFYLNPDSDEVVWGLAGEFTFAIGGELTVGGPGTCAFFPRGVAHAWKNTGGKPGRVLFIYAPVVPGSFSAALAARRRTNDSESDRLGYELLRYHGKVTGPNPFDRSE